MLVEDFSFLGAVFQYFPGLVAHFLSGAAQSWEKKISPEGTYSTRNFSAAPCV